MTEGSNAPPEPLSAVDHDRLVQLCEAVSGLERRLDDRIGVVDKRVGEVINWKHHDLPPVIASMQKDALTMQKDMAALVVATAANTSEISRLAQMMGGVADMPRRQEDHEEACVRSRQEDMTHRDAFETHVGARFDRSDAARDELKKMIDHTRTWVVSGVLSTLVTLLIALVSIIWVIVQRGGLGLFHG